MTNGAKHIITTRTIIATVLMIALWIVFSILLVKGLIGDLIFMFINQTTKKEIMQAQKSDY